MITECSKCGATFFNPFVGSRQVYVDCLKCAPSDYPARLRTPAPTFDEWFVSRNGMTFDELHLLPRMRVDAAHRALLQALRDYVSDTVRSWALSGH